MLKRRNSVYSRLSCNRAINKNLLNDIKYMNLYSNQMGIVFYLFLVASGLAAAYLISKALKAIKLI